MVCGLNTNAENSVCDELYVCDEVKAGRQYLYMYMQVRVPVQKEATGHASPCSSLSYVPQGNLSKPEAHIWARLACQIMSTFCCPCSTITGWGGRLTRPGFLHGCWDSNSISQACKASTLIH